MQNLFGGHDRKKKVVFFFSIVFTIIFLYWFIPPVWKLKDHSATMTVTRSRVNGKTTLETVGPSQPNWMPYSQVAISLTHAIVSSEDDKFFHHMGIDITELWNSLKLNLEKGKYVRGGSTITQQTVKVLFLSSNKSLIRKFREIFGALIIEWVLTKEEILEWYFNILHLGKGIYGVKEASFFYFNKTPLELDITDSIHLSMILPNPITWSASIRSENLTEFGERRFKIILEKMIINKFVSEAEKNYALEFGNFGYPIVVDHDWELNLEEVYHPH